MVSKNLLYGPASAYAAIESAIIKTKPFCPNRDRMCFAIPSEKVIVPLVTPLLLSGSPCAILGRVMPIVVQTLNMMLRRWARTHVMKKLGEIVAPFWADTNTPRTVIFIACLFWIVTASTHIEPNSVLRTVPHSVRAQECSNEFALQTTTTFCPSKGEFGAIYNYLIPARTLTEPMRLSRPDIKEFYNYKSAKTLPFKVTETVAMFHTVNISRQPERVKRRM